jgi:hypothetical protein
MLNDSCVVVSFYSHGRCFLFHDGSPQCRQLHVVIVVSDNVAPCFIVNVVVVVVLASLVFVDAILTSERIFKILSGTRR